MVIELYRIQLLARWASAIIMRYCRLAPLTTITSHVRELQASNSVAKVIDKLNADVKAMADQLAVMDMNTQKLMNIEVNVASMEKQAEEAAAPPKYVVDDETKCCDTILCMAGSPVDWVTPCKWIFGRVRHSFASEPVDGYKLLCHRCFPKLRTQRKAAGLLY